MSETNKEYKITIMNDAYLFDGQGKVYTWLILIFRMVRVHHLLLPVELMVLLLIQFHLLGRMKWYVIFI